MLAWKTTHKINNLVILDDDESGYDALTRSFYLVKILSENGLTEQDIEKAKAKLSKK